jgi:hypothetical protein
MEHRPHLMPKLRSKALMAAMAGYPCTLRISGFIPGHGCSPQNTVVGCHPPLAGKGISTKVTDMSVCAGCFHCHELLDGRDKRGPMIAKAYPAAYHLRIAEAMQETQAFLLQDGIIQVPGAELI